MSYLDRIRLDVLDHPVGSEVYPNELFCFPPFPEATVHAVEAPLAALQKRIDELAAYPGDPDKEREASRLRDELQAKRKKV